MFVCVWNQVSVSLSLVTPEAHSWFNDVLYHNIIIFMFCIPSLPPHILSVMFHVAPVSIFYFIGARVLSLCVLMHMVWCVVLALTHSLLTPLNFIPINDKWFQAIFTSTVKWHSIDNDNTAGRPVRTCLLMLAKTREPCPISPTYTHTHTHTSHVYRHWSLASDPSFFASHCHSQG